MKTTVVISGLLLAAILTGSLQMSAQAQDIGSMYAAARESFAETVPLIPGYNAPYPFAAVAQGADDAPATTESMGSSASIALGSFAATAPAIPGYNAAYAVCLAC
jgi:hypothetical protein